MQTAFYFPSKDQKTEIHGVKWQKNYGETQEPVAILQIIHGMAEHILRYHDFAEYLCKKNFIVYGHDHLGHGASIQDEVYGYFSEENSADVLVEDAYSVTQKIKQEYPNTPLFILGHSMGSLVLRCYLKKYSHEVCGGIIMGTTGPQTPVKVALPLIEKIEKRHPKKVNYVLDKIAFGLYPYYFKDHQSNFDWISRNRENITAYLDDPLSGFIFTNNGFLTLMHLAYEATKPDWWETIRKDLPLFIISGEEDPVGQMGKGPRIVASELGNHDFEDVTLSLYPHLRHEILNEKEAIIIYRQLYSWMDKLLEN